MATPLIAELERQFEQLSSQAQRDLLERLSHRVRILDVQKSDLWDAELSAMASDEEVQREIKAMSSEFTNAESDGLEGLEAR